MVGDDRHEHVLNYGITDGSNLAYMPHGKYFCVGYNNRFGLIDVMEGHGPDGTPGFEGRINIESLIEDAELGSDELNETVESYIMKAYGNMVKHRLNPEDDPDRPILNVLKDNYAVAMK